MYGKRDHADMKKRLNKDRSSEIYKERKSVAKKIISTVLIVGLAAATTFLSGLSADEENARLEKEVHESKPAIEYVVDLPKDNFEFEFTEEKKVHKVRSKKWSLLSLPLWLIGQIGALLLRPLIGKLLSYLFIALVFFGILCLCLKIMFPDTPLRELLTKKNILTFVCCTGVFIAALHVPELLDMNTDHHGIFSFLAGALCVLTMMLLCSDNVKSNINEGSAA